MNESTFESNSIQKKVSLFGIHFLLIILLWVTLRNWPDDT